MDKMGEKMKNFKRGLASIKTSNGPSRTEKYTI